MSKALVISYKDLVKQYENTIKYAIKTSDVFSVVSFTRKPYSSEIPVTDNDELMKVLEETLIKKFINRNGWPGNETRDIHRAISIYKCCRLSRDELLKIPNIFLAFNNNMPEDICFYRNGIAWLVTVSHEEYAFMCYASKEDIEFLEKNNIDYSCLAENIKYLLPSS